MVRSFETVNALYVPNQLPRCASEALMEKTFWLTPEAWPTDPAGHVFLARAVHRIGAAIFGKEWIGDEPATQPIELLPDRLKKTFKDDDRAEEILKRISAAFVLKRKQSYQEWKLSKSRGLWPGVPISREEWLEAQTAIEREADARRPALVRIDTVRREIVKGCEAGELVTTVRPVIGGDMKALSSSVWNTESWQVRFVCCQIDPKFPYASRAHRNDYSWIFLTSASLEKFLLSQPFANITLSDEQHLSPYLRVMLGVAKNLKITPANQPKKDVVVEEIRRLWRGSPLSEKMIETMATILREPESQLGRARRREVTTQPAK
jgi:hypothetical protein